MAGALHFSCRLIVLVAVAIRAKSFFQAPWQVPCIGHGLPVLRFASVPRDVLAWGRRHHTGPFKPRWRCWLWRQLSCTARPVLWHGLRGAVHGAMSGPQLVEHDVLRLNLVSLPLTVIEGPRAVARCLRPCFLQLSASMPVATCSSFAGQPQFDHGHRVQV